MAFPDTPLTGRVELSAGGVWTDVTGHAFTRAPITITRGIPDGAGVSDPSRCSMALNNLDGRYSPRNPLSPYYGQIGRNSPLRVSVPGDVYLLVPEGVAGRAATPDHASLDITGDIDVRVEVEPDLWLGAGNGYELIGKYDIAIAQRSWRLLVTGEGELLFSWSTNGTAFLEHRSPKIPVIGQRMAVRSTLDVNNGSGGYTLTHYVAESIAGPWTQIGQTVTTSGTTSIFNSTTALEVGDIATLGFTNHQRRIYAAQVRNGIGGSIVANPTFTAQTAGATSFVDSAGRTWTLAGGSSISDRQYRFVGEVSEWPTRWVPSGEDVWVSLDAAGTLRRLGQGKKPIGSTLRRRLPSRASLLAYWPCEDDNGSTQAYSPMAGVAPLQVTGWTFAQDDTLGGSSALPTITPGGSMRGQILPPLVAGTTWAVCMPYRVDGAAPVAEQEMLSWTSTGTVRRWRITMGATGTHILGYDAAGTLTVNAAYATGSNLFDDWWRLEFKAVQNGGNVDYTLTFTQIGGGGTSVGGSIAGTVGILSQLNTSFGPGLPDIRVGHITAWSESVIAAAYDSADKGFIGEAATARLTRLGTEEADTLRLKVINGIEKLSEAMGPQRTMTLLDVLRECADSDGGMLTEARTDAALVYRERGSLYNQTPRMIIPYGDIEPDLEPVDDDQTVRNDRTVSRIGGTSARAVLETGPLSVQPPPAGVGLYDDSQSLSLATDVQTDHIANWLLHLGTWDESRYPTVKLALHKRPDLIATFLRLELGDRIRITDPPLWLPPGPVDLLVRGITETLGIRTWEVTLACVPAGPWTVGVVDDTEARADTESCVVDATINSTTTTVVFTTFTLPRWVDSATYASDFPFDVLIGGERMTVTAITGTGTTQTATVIRSVNGIVKGHDAGTPVGLAEPTYAAL